MMNLNRIFLPSQDQINEKWIVIDAEGKVAGRLASEIVKKIRGSDQEFYSPSVKVGQRVIVINAEKIILTGNKMTDKDYRKYTRYIGNCKNFTSKDLFEKKPTYILEHAIKGMLKKNKLENQLFKTHIKIYSGPNHKHIAQTNKKSETAN